MDIKSFERTGEVKATQRFCKLCQGVYPLNYFIGFDKSKIPQEQVWVHQHCYILAANNGTIANSNQK